MKRTFNLISLNRFDTIISFAVQKYSSQEKKTLLLKTPINIDAKLVSVYLRTKLKFKAKIFILPI